MKSRDFIRRGSQKGGRIRGKEKEIWGEGGVGIQLVQWMTKWGTFWKISSRSYILCVFNHVKEVNLDFHCCASLFWELWFWKFWVKSCLCSVCVPSLRVMTQIIISKNSGVIFSQYFPQPIFHLLVGEWTRLGRISDWKVSLAHFLFSPFFYSG